MAKRKRAPKFVWVLTPEYAGYGAKERAKDRRLQRTYGITLAQYRQKLAEQHYSCALCRRHQSNFKTALHVDHNHATGQVRGAVCFTCNKYRIGRNNTATVAALYAYMTKFERAK